MPKYMFRASYTPAGIAGILREGGSSRIKAMEEMASSVGGSIEAAYWGFGNEDFYLIGELPDNKAAAALSATVGASGIASVVTVPLLTADDIDAAVATAQSVIYRPPGT